MAEKSSAWVWVLGCLGVSVLAAVICAGGLFFLIRSGAEMAGEFLEQEAQRAQFASEWNPPAEGSTDTDLFPAQVDQFQLLGTPDHSAMSEFAIEEEVDHAVYQGAAGKVDVYITPIEAGSSTDYFEALAAKLESGSYGSKSTFGGFGTHSYFAVSPPDRTGWMWSTQNWLVLVVSDSKYDPEPFLRSYLTAIQGPEVSPPAESDLPTEEAPTETMDPQEVPDAPVDGDTPVTEDPANSL